MNEKVLKVLEFDKIRAMLAEKCYSVKAKKKALETEPFGEMVLIERAQSEVEEALGLIFSKGGLSFSGIKETGSAMKRAKSGGMLSPAELLKTVLLLENTERVKNYPEEGLGENSVLRDRFDCLTPLPEVVRAIRKCVIDEETISDNASDELFHIRKKKKKAADSIHTTLQELIRGKLRTYLMESVITMRDNRYCVPVKAEYKGNVAGMVHDISSTGSTLFIEPAAIVELNNNIRELEGQEKKEIDRILTELSALCGENAHLIESNEKLLVELDYIFGKAEFALELNATRPVFNTGEIIRLRAARHPLLDKKKAVPIDIHLGEEFDLLIVTGPNTGGKTVALKTVGLLQVMGLSGLFIPAGDRSQLSFFREIYADIGDEQSIEQSLSTFSSHMTNVVNILKNANIMSLCLFDELGAGTDPTEGAALAEAVLRFLHKRSIRTIATTHYAELKEYALTTNWVENACCEFDVESLRPTYRILVGVPGKSNAFAISEKLGLPAKVIEEAKGLMNEEDKRLEKLMANLEESRQAAEKERREILKEREDSRQLKERLREKEQKLEENREKLLQKAKDEAKEILSEAKSTADETIKQMQKLAGPEALRRAEKERDRIRENLKRTRNTQSLSANDPLGVTEYGNARAKGHKTLSEKDLSVGCSVKIISMNLKGTVKTLPDKKGFLTVQCGIIGNKVHISDLVLTEEKSAGSTSKLGHTKTISAELMLIGKNSDEARAELEAYLDDAYLSHLGQVRIVHGKGSGILRDAVHAYLKKCKYVDEYRLGEFGEGDAGVTIVKFK
ncbi:MAG: endonuclease MutS2 [Lachnospiraceae bacterium]|nr:endonuclease MutS2 [Lachnospiraceae bacterium]